MSVLPHEDQLINEMHFYSVHVRRYDRERILDQDASLKHIFELYSMEVVIAEICNTSWQVPKRKNRIIESLIMEGEISDNEKARQKISLALDTLKDFCNWKREQQMKASAVLAEVVK